MQKRVKFIGILSLFVIFLTCICSVFISTVGLAEQSDTEITIKIETDYDIYNLPLGKEKATYPIFSCSVSMSNGASVDSTDVKVYYDVNGDTKTQGNTNDDVLVVVDNERFITDKAGEYVIEYVAIKDFDVKIERLYVKVISETDYVQPKYVINSQIKSQVFTGEQVYLPDGQIVADARFGNTQVNISVEYQGEYDCDEIEVNAFDERIKYFTPRVSGEYTVVYEISDILGQANVVKVSKTISVIDNEKPIIKAPSFVNVYSLGETIKFPYVEAVQYIDGKVVYVPVTTTFDGNEIDENAEYTPSECGKFDVVFTAKNAVYGLSDSSITYEIEVKDKNPEIPYVNSHIKLDGFNGFYRTENDEGLENDVYVLETDGSQETAQMSFKTKIALPFLQANVGIEKAYCNFTELSVIITDSKNVSEQVELSVCKSQNGYADLYFNGLFVKTYKYLSGDNKNTEIKFEDLAGEFYFSYDYKTKSLVDASGSVITEIKSYLNGSEFLGFSSNKVYLKICLGGISDKSQVKLYTLATEYISGATTDKTKPKIVLQTEVANNIAHTADVNNIVIIKKYDSFDLYDENVTTNLKIVSPNQNLVVDEVMTGDYEFMVTECGFYEIVYEFIDSAGQKRLSTGIIQVIDRVAPTVENLSEISFKSTVGVGKTYEFPVLTFKDNVSTELTTYIYLTYGNYQKVIVKDNKFTFEKRGEYVVSYSAVDEAGNTTVVSFTIECK